MSALRQRIALIHAVRVAMQPVEDAFAEHWPEAERINLLDDALSPDRERDGVLTDEMAARIASLAEYAARCGAAGILYTCSAFGDAIERVQRAAAIPVLKPNEAMFLEAASIGSRIGMLATFAPSVASMEKELAALAPGVELRTECIPDAMAALKAGDGKRHDRLLAAAARRFEGCDAVMLAHFSTARAEGAVQGMLDCPVLTAPASAVRAMRSRLGG